MLFTECWLKAGLLRSLESTGYKIATPIQEKVIKLAFEWKNIVWQSQTWTGKTAAFLLPVLNKIDTNKKILQALVIVPTRELANQIGDEIRNLTKFYGVSYACLYGWASPNVQKKNLRRNPVIIVATPGRLMDFMNQKVVDIRTVEYFVLDEVDRMLDMWFVRDIKKIWAQLKNVKQTYTFSATMNHEMKTIIKQHVSDYEFIKIGEKVTVDKINHRYMLVDHEHKIHNVIKLIKEYSRDKILIFTHTKRNTKILHTILNRDNFSVGMLNGNMSQNKRQSTLDAFKKGKTRILITTDVAARWLNMDNVGLVINLEAPSDVKTYIHRIWRTGRAWASGEAIMLISPLEIPLLKEIEKIHKIKIQKSEHIPELDREWVHKKVRLNRSTDKQWWGRNQSRPQKPRYAKSGSTNSNYKKSGPKWQNSNNRRYKKKKWPSGGGRFRGIGKNRHK